MSDRAAVPAVPAVTSPENPLYDGPQMGDAFGAMLLACWEAGFPPSSYFELVERDDGFIDPMDATFYFAGPAEWNPLDHWLIERAHGRVLDVGSGAGRVSLHLQQRGSDVTALDVSALALEVCRRRGVRQTFHGSVPDLATRIGQRTAQRFDSFLLLGNNMALLGGAEHAPRFLDALAACAAPGASVLGAGMDPYGTSNPLHHAYHARNRVRGRMGGQIAMRVRFRNLATPWFDYLFATIDELRGLLEGSPWRLESHQPHPSGPGYAVQLTLRP